MVDGQPDGPAASSRAIAKLLLIHLLQLGSIALFAAGFFLTRPELPNVSLPQDFADARHLARFNRSIILVVDAMRYDFMSPIPPEQGPKMFHNQMASVARCVQEQPEKCLLLKFVADPPTTTMQRIKGMTSGSLPTFIDFSKNFASEAIAEDNFVWQLARSNRGVVFMGDDTWQSLLGHTFVRSFPYPSFNVMDLDTVDNGVMTHLHPEMQRPDWSLIVGHFLGLDHAGHRYELNHHAIVNKLHFVDKVITDIMEKIEQDTLLIVLGDHGMTPSGDHGGDTPDELDAGIFLYSKQPLQDTRQKHLSQGYSDTVRQIDLVPTFSLLMGIPIPFSSLGRIIPQLFSLSEASLHHALDVNMRQMERYKVLTDVPEASFPTKPPPDASWEDKIQYLGNISESYRQLWATFDMPLMISALLLMIISCILHVVFVISLLTPAKAECRLLSTAQLPFALMASGITTAILSHAGYAISLAILCAIITGLSSTALYITISRQTPWIAVVALSIPGLVYGAISFSNSFILLEAHCLNFLSNSTILAMAFLIVRKSGKLTPVLSSVFWASLCSFLTRFFLSHPEDTSDTNVLLKPLSSLPSDVSDRRFLVTVLCLTVFVGLTLRWLKNSNSLHDNSMNTVWFNFGLPLAAVWIILHWALGSMQHAKYERMPDWTKTLFPQLCYLKIVIGLALFVCCPNMVSVKRVPPPSTRPRPVVDAASKDIVPQLAKSLFSQPSSNHNHVARNGVTTTAAAAAHNNLPTFHVAGLPDCLASAWHLLSTPVILLLYLVGSNGAAISLTMLLVQTLAVSSLLVTLAKHSSESTALVLGAFALNFMAGQYYYATGHQLSIASVRFEAAYTGFMGELKSFVLPGALVVCNTFGAYFLVLVLLPLAVYQVHAGGATHHGGTRVLLTALSQRPTLHRHLLATLASFSLISALKVMMTMGADIVLRRHLMAHRIFVPNLIFQTLIFASVISCQLLLLLPAHHWLLHRTAHLVAALEKLH